MKAREDRPTYQVSNAPTSEHQFNYLLEALVAVRMGSAHNPELCVLLDDVIERGTAEMSGTQNSCL